MLSRSKQNARAAEPWTYYWRGEKPDELIIKEEKKRTHRYQRRANKKKLQHELDTSY